MTGSYPKVEVLPGPERRRRWSSAEKLEIVAETREPGVAVSLVARRLGVSPNQLFTWRRLADKGALVATHAEEEVVLATTFRARQEPIGELHRLLWQENPTKRDPQGSARVRDGLKKRTLRSLSLPKGDSR
jgi:transposase